MKPEAVSPQRSSPSVYATCLQCHARLGRNELLPTFPVGRRLAYDLAGARLWVVCARCSAWNLAPFEERFDAMEEAERRYRATPTRVATGEIGLARLRDGMGAVDLVRIGAPLRPEFAGWRYGERFLARNRRQWIAGGFSVAASVVSVLGSTARIASGVGSGVMIADALLQWHRLRRLQRVRLDLPGIDRPVVLKRTHLSRVILLPRGEAFALRLMHPAPQLGRFAEARALLEGDDALRVARAVLPAINANGGSRKNVAGAVDLLEAELARSRHALIARLTDHGRLTFLPHAAPARDDRDERWLGYLPLEKRLALEMALNEEVERRAMEGELALLEAAWRDAERIAAIADSLALPEQLDAAGHG